MMTDIEIKVKALEALLSDVHYTEENDIAFLHPFKASVKEWLEMQKALLPPEKDVCCAFFAEEIQWCPVHSKMAPLDIKPPMKEG